MILSKKNEWLYKITMRFGILYANIHTIRFRYHWLDIINYWFGYHIFF